MFDWASVSPTQFERLCKELLELEGFHNVKWFGKGGGDKGRDLMATKIDEPLPGSRRIRQWLVQCKRYVNKRLTKGEIDALLVAAKEHGIDEVLIITTTTISADVRDWLAVADRQHDFGVHLWEETDLEREVRRHHKSLSDPPQVSPRRGEPIFFYEMHTHELHLMCNDFDDVGFFLFNVTTRYEAFERVGEFIEFIRHNPVEFDITPEVLAEQEEHRRSLEQALKRIESRRNQAAVKTPSEASPGRGDGSSSGSHNRTAPGGAGVSDST